MSAALELSPPAGGWTTDHLDELPEGPRFELIDGALIVTPSPTPHHQTLAMRLGVLLESHCPLDWAVTQAVEVRISRSRSLTPDLLVVTAKAAGRGSAVFQPHEVTLVVEIVSPGSVTMDRVAKPALYAQAGIPFYWRVETEGGIAVHTHRLDGEAEVYRPTGTFTETVEVDTPWPMTLPVASFTPRFFRP